MDFGTFWPLILLYKVKRALTLNVNIFATKFFYLNSVKSVHSSGLSTLKEALLARMTPDPPYRLNSRDFSVLLVVFSSTDCFTTCTAGVIQDPVVGVLFLYLFASILLGMQEFLIWQSIHWKVSRVRNLPLLKSTIPEQCKCHQVLQLSQGAYYRGVLKPKNRSKSAWKLKNRTSLPSKPQTMKICKTATLL